MLCCGYTLTDFPISIRLTSLALGQSNDCPSASKATLMNMDKYFMWIHYERLHNHNKAKHNKTVFIFLGIYCTYHSISWDESCGNIQYYRLISYSSQLTGWNNVRSIIPEWSFCLDIMTYSLFYGSLKVWCCILRNFINQCMDKKLQLIKYWKRCEGFDPESIIT